VFTIECRAVNKISINFRHAYLTRLLLNKTNKIALCTHRAKLQRSLNYKCEKDSKKCLIVLVDIWVKPQVQIQSKAHPQIRGLDPSLRGIFGWGPCFGRRIGIPDAFYEDIFGNYGIRIVLRNSFPRLPAWLGVDRQTEDVDITHG
jgi:hypothetical protein